MEASAASAVDVELTAAAGDLQRRQRRLSLVASAARQEVVSLRQDRGELLAQLNALAKEVSALPRAPKPLANANEAALRVLHTKAAKQGHSIAQLTQNREVLCFSFEFPNLISELHSAQVSQTARRA